MLKLYKRDTFTTAPVERVPAAVGAAYKPGQALTVTDGAAATATGAPLYIAQGPAAGGTVPCIRVHHDMVFQAPLTAVGTALKVGDKVTLSADGLGVTAATAAGVAEIVQIDGTSVGSTVKVRF